MQQRKIIAVPLLVYVAANHAFFAARGEGYIAPALLDFLQRRGVAAFTATDYDLAPILVDQGEDKLKLSRSIHEVCRFTANTGPSDVPPLDQALSLLLKHLGPHFDATQSWEGLDDAIDYCSRQQDPGAAMFALAISNYAFQEKGWTGELIMEAPDVWETPKTSVLEAALPQLKRLSPSYAYPGYIHIVKDGIDFAFGSANGDYGFDYATDPAEEGIREGGESTLSRHASVTALANWIIEQVRATCEKYPLKAPKPELHLNVAVPVDRPDLIVKAWKEGFLACEPETTQVFIYDEDYPDSPRLMEFARRHNLEYVGTTAEGERRPWVEYPAAGHSPGPWSQEPADFMSMCIADAGGVSLCDVYRNHDRNPIPQAEANASLIEAAPDMLKSLVTTADYLATFFKEGREHRVVREADAVIAKATKHQGPCPT